MTIFCDLDGVLSQFATGAAGLHGKALSLGDITTWNFHYAHLGFSRETEAEFYAPMGYDFWAGLERHEDGFTLFSRLESLGLPIALVSSPCDTPGCRDGKVAWVRKHLPNYVKSLFLGSNKSLLASFDKILLDDSDANVESFRAAGGRAVLIPRPWNNRRRLCYIDGNFDPETVYANVRALI